MTAIISTTALESRGGILSHAELCDIVAEGVITNVAPDMVNAASIDITVGNVFFIEDTENPRMVVIGDTAEERVGPIMKRVELAKGESIVLKPGQVALCSSEQVFNLPNNLSCEYKEKSSMGRSFLQHMMSGWCDAGWNGSVLTMEIKNVTEAHPIAIRPGVRLGQMVFFPHATVGEEASYAKRGRYNGDTEAKEVKP